MAIFNEALTRIELRDFTYNRRADEFEFGQLAYNLSWLAYYFEMDKPVNALVKQRKDLQDLFLTCAGFFSTHKST